jgi:polyisoprenoid-binding protein YceI
MHTLLLLLAVALADAPPEPVEVVPTPAPVADEPLADDTDTDEPEPEPAGPVDLVLDRGRTSIYALVYKAGAAGAVAHDHVIHAPDFEGSGTFDPASPERSEIAIVVSVTGLLPDADAMRQKVGLPNTLSDGQREEILSHILSEYQLFAERYDTIKFTSTSMTGALPEVQVTGDFTLRGVTKRITVPMKITAQDDGGFRAKGSFRILQSDYGYKPYTALFGALRNRDEVDVVIDARLVPR